MSANKQTPNRSQQKSHSTFQRLARRFMSGLLRSLFFASRKPTHGKAGFVLPTTVLLLLMVSLTVGAMSYRTFSRTSQTIAYRNQQVIDSLAAPAIDRAKAKIEFLFTKDPLVADKRPPSSTDLLTALEAGKNDIYLIPDETYVDLDGDGTTYDNAWSFLSPDNNTTVFYSLVLDDSNNGVSIDSDVPDATKAANFVARNGPIDTTAPKDKCPVERLAGDGWQLSGARLAKNIQVDILSTKGSGPSKTVSAAEYQQVRTASRGTRWGAWFRYDMEIAPGGALRWNGAMHTEGSLIASGAKTIDSGKLIAYMISSADSCVYDDDASVIEVSGRVDNDGDDNYEFQGQLVSGVVGESGDGSFLNNRAVFHTDITATQPDTSNASNPYNKGVSKLSKNSGSSSDTITPENSGSAADVMQDPIQIFTEDKFIHVSPQELNASDRKWTRDASGGTPRVENDTTGAARPFLDDSFRADDRYGPKPTYNSTNGLAETNGVDLATPYKIGQKITSNDLLTKYLPGNQDYGLDGYWERSAVAEGLRLIVGQRLELGNTFGWKGNDDPLYPARSVGNMETDSGDKLKGPAERLQMRSLRDNLAAVQSMAVYHSLDANGGHYPLACIASTVHPGTQQTLVNSRTFGKYSYSGTPLKTDFLTGHGTNGVEFPLTSKSNLGVTTTTVDGVSVDQMTIAGIATDWSNALNNLAYFAGDPKGGAPSFPAEQEKLGAAGDEVHPYPYLSMWGDFSILRRVLGLSGTLSIADQSTVHTAACTLGMLAYNLDSVEKEAKSIINDHLSDLISVIDDSTSKAAIDTKATVKEKFDFISSNMSSSLTSEEVDAINLYRQVERDRRLGFLLDDSTTPGSDICSATEFDDVSGTITTAQKDSLASVLCVQTASDIPYYPSLYYIFPVADHTQYPTQPTGEDYISEDIFDTNVDTGTDNRYIKTINTADYITVEPSDIALVPNAPTQAAWRTPVRLVEDNGSNFGSFSGPSPAPSAAFDNSAQSDPGNLEKNLSQNIIRIKDGSNYDFYQTALLDKAIMDGRELLSVRLMDLDIDLLTNVGSSTSLTDADTTVGGKAWIREDSGIVYAFREDAIREDAIVRPYSSGLDSNADTAWDSCKTVTALTTDADCYMNIDPTTPHDPPLNSGTGISPKPVDMYADPLRRPYGFRLSNGESLNRPDVSGNEISAGMTLVSDNPIYIKGDFNLHAEKNVSDLEAALIEEFKGPGNLLGTEFAEFGSNDNNEKAARKLFYGRNTLDERFARPNEDNWRPVEIFADSTNILSNIFLDGWIEDYFVTQSRTPNNSNRGKPTKNSSYLNANRPFFTSGSDYDSDKWRREKDNDVSTPVLVDRDAKVERKDTSGSFGEFPKVSGGRSISFYQKTADAPDGEPLFRARQIQQPYPERTTISTPKAPVRINALLIGGIVPAREGQSYGGFHNFPRLLEFWAGRQLVISGGFFQLNFSSQAVAPYDQDAWEPGDPVYSGSGDIGNTGNSKSSEFYYGAADRIWGYDVALQYTPAAPISRRFVRLDRPRSEFYRELPVDDPYIALLCNAAGGGC